MPNKITKKLTFQDVSQNHFDLDFIIVTPYQTIDTSLYNSIAYRTDDVTHKPILELERTTSPLHAVTIRIQETDCTFIQIKEGVGHLKDGKPIKEGGFI